MYRCCISFQAWLHLSPSRGRSRLRCSWSVTKNVTRRKAKQSLIKKKFLNTRFLARFPAQKNAGCTNASHDFSPRKYNVLLPQTGWLLTPFLPPKESTDGWRTLTSEQKFLGWIDYQIFLGMELRSRTWSSAIKKSKVKVQKRAQWGKGNSTASCFRGSILFSNSQLRLP